MTLSLADWLTRYCQSLTQFLPQFISDGGFQKGKNHWGEIILFKLVADFPHSFWLLLGIVSGLLQCGIFFDPSIIIHRVIDFCFQNIDSIRKLLVLFKSNKIKKNWVTQVNGFNFCRLQYTLEIFSCYYNFVQ